MEIRIDICCEAFRRGRCFGETLLGRIPQLIQSFSRFNLWLPTEFANYPGYPVLSSRHPQWVDHSRSFSNDEPTGLPIIRDFGSLAPVLNHYGGCHWMRQSFQIKDSQDWAHLSQKLARGLSQHLWISCTKLEVEKILESQAPWTLRKGDNNCLMKDTA